MYSSDTFILFDISVPKHAILYVVEINIYLSFLGSHDSFTSKITPNSDIAPDAEDIVKALSHLGPVVKYILANWSITQANWVEEQLKNGIRYFDIRIATKSKSTDYYIVHTLYSQTVFPLYEKINEFLNSHPQEVSLNFKFLYNI